jgi:hypothetical protein
MISLFLVAAAVLATESAAAEAPAGGDGSCGPRDLAAARTRFDRLYRAQSYAEAFDDLRKLKERCWGSLAVEERGRIASDLGLAAFRNGKPDLCLKMLDDAPAELPANSKVAKSISFNPGLCAPPPVTSMSVGTTRPSQVAGLCAKREKVVRIVPKKFEDLPERPGHATFAKSDIDGTETKLMLDARAELNGDGVAEMIFEAPDEIARDARFLSWFVDCGNGNFYELLSEYAADYEIDQKEENGWRLLQLYNRPSPDSPSSTKVSQTTYRFNGSIYVSVRSQKIKRRTFSISPN